MTTNQSLHGIYAASVTPFDDNGFPALHLLSAHLRHLESNGCHGVAISGTTGEGPSLSVDERISLFQAAAAERGNLKLMAGTGAPSLTDAITLTRAAFEAGFDSVLVIPPFYFRQATIEGLFSFYAELVRQAVPEDGDVVLYHFPNMSGVPIDKELIRRLRSEFPNQVVGIKDSSGSLEHTTMLCQEFEGLRVFVGSDKLLAEGLDAGAAGAITALSNVFSRRLRDVYDAHEAEAATEELQARLTALRENLEALSKPFPASVKTILHLQGLLPNDSVRPPLRRLDEQTIHKVQEYFDLQTSGA